MSESLQVRNAALVNWLSGDLQPRYEPNFAWKSAIAAHLALPGLRGFWPMSTVGVAGEAQDLQSLGNHLTLNGDPQFSYEGLIPYCQYDGTGDFHDITDAASGNAFDILATAAAEPWIADNGLTVGCWVYLEETGTQEFIIAKWSAAAGNYSYQLLISAANVLTFRISDDGTNFDTAVAAATTTFDAWYFVVGRFRPNAFVDIFVNDVEVSQATARAAVFNGSANFTIAARSGGAVELQGRISMAWICAAQLSDAIIRALYQQTRAMFGV